MLGIIGAMEEEVSRLTSAMEEVRIVRRAAMEFYEGKLSGRDAVVVRSGIGKVNAGICAQILSALLPDSAALLQVLRIPGQLKHSSAPLRKSAPYPG